MKSLKEIFWSLPKHADKWEPYFDVYEHHFSRFRGKSPRILEIGVQHGGSSLMWLEYFGPGTKVVGIDIDPRCKNHEQENIEIIIGDQSRDDFWLDFLDTNKEQFDIIIDDGSHYQHDMILSFVMTSRQVKDSGVYLVEDCHTSYYRNHRVENRQVDFAGGVHNPNSFIEFAKFSIDAINFKHIETAGDKVDPELLQLYDRVKHIHFYDSIVVFDIGPRASFNRCLNSGTKMF